MTQTASAASSSEKWPFGEPNLEPEAFAPGLTHTVHPKHSGQTARQSANPPKAQLRCQPYDQQVLTEPVTRPCGAGTQRATRPVHAEEVFRDGSVSALICWLPNATGGLQPIPSPPYAPSLSNLRWAFQSPPANLRTSLAPPLVSQWRLCSRINPFQAKIECLLQSYTANACHHCIARAFVAAVMPRLLP